MASVLRVRWYLVALAMLVCGAAGAGELDDAFIVLSKSAPQSVADLQVIEQAVAKIAKRVVPCTVGVQVGQNHGSGVVVDKDGLVLTAAHVAMRPGRTAILRFPDGTTVRGTTLGMNMEADGALIQINEKGEWPFAPLVTLDDYPRPGDWCIATGHPGGFDAKRTPPVRFGRIIDVNKYVLRTDCPINSGDSGGPLFDMQGHVIGIHSRISEQATVNLHGPVLEFLDSWDAMKAGKIYPPAPASRFLARLDIDKDGKITRAEMPDDAYRGIFDRLVQEYHLDKKQGFAIDELKKKLGWKDVPARLKVQPYELNSQSGHALAANRFIRGQKVLAAGKEVVKPVLNSVVEVRCEGKRVALGTVVKQGVLTKASELTKDITCQTRDGRELKAEVRAVDKESDLALLQVPEKLPAIVWASDATSLHLGDWVITPGLKETPISIGVVSVAVREVEGTHGYLGIAIGEHEMGVLVNQVVDKSGASRAGIKPNDVIISVFGNKVTSPEELQKEVFKYRAGDIVEAIALRDGAEVHFKIKLGMQEDIFSFNERFGSGRLNGKLSPRRDDFHAALQHDSVIVPADCGGPILNTAGQVVGINIARVDRVGSYAIPSQAVQEVIAKWEKDPAASADANETTAEPKS